MPAHEGDCSISYLSSAFETSDLQILTYRCMAGISGPVLVSSTSCLAFDFGGSFSHVLLLHCAAFLKDLG